MSKRLKRRRRYDKILKRKRTARNLASKLKAKERRRANLPSLVKQHSMGYGRRHPRLRAPKYFSLLRPNDREQVLEFLAALRSMVLDRKQKVAISFDETVQFHASATLLFRAELERMARFLLSISRDDAKKVDISQFAYCEAMPKDKVAAQVMQHVGLATLLGGKNVLEISADTVRFWRHATGYLIDGEELESIFRHYEGVVYESLKGSLYRGVTEAMGNSVEHAYQEERGDGIPLSVEKRWWMFSQEKDGMLTVACCDLGIGIPRHLKSGRRWTLKDVFAWIQKFGARKKDSSYIRVALQLGMSATNRQGRGKGFQDIIKVIERTGRGEMRIFSNHGVYEYKSRIEDWNDYPTSIMGTIVEWTIPLESGEDQGHGND